MTKMFAPILAFTCDEIWLAMPHRAEDDARNVLLNVMNQPFDAYALSNDELAKWDQLIRVRTDVNGVLEAARAEKLDALRAGRPRDRTVPALRRRRRRAEGGVNHRSQNPDPKARNRYVVCHRSHPDPHR